MTTAAILVPTGEMTENLMRPGKPSVFLSIDNGQQTVGLLVHGPAATSTARMLAHRVISNARSAGRTVPTITRQWIGQDGTVYPKD